MPESPGIRAAGDAPADIPGLLLTLRRGPDGSYGLPAEDGAAEDLFGLPPERLRADARILLGQVHPEDCARLLGALDAALAAPGPFHLRWRHWHPAKGWRWLEVWSRPSREPDGGQAWRGFVLDVTGLAELEAAVREKDRHLRAEEASRFALRDSEVRYRSFFELSRAVMLLLDPATGRIEDANPAAVAFYGWDRADLLARRMDQINTLPMAGIEPVLRDVQSGQLNHFFTRHRLADGRVREVEVFANPMRLDGKDLNFAIIHDVTEQRQAEAARRESEERYRELFEHCPVSVWEEDLSGVAARFAELRAAGVTDLAAHLAAHPEEVRTLVAGVRVRSMNAAGLKLMAVDRPEELGPDLNRCLPDAALAVAGREFAALFHGASRFEAELAHLDSRGRPLDIQLQVNVVPGHETDLARVLISSIDLTERRAAESERRRMERELNHLQRLESLGRLAGGVSHDMNNVLAAILGMASSATNDLPASDPMAAAMETIAKACLRGRNVLKSLLVFTRRELGEEKRIDLNALVRETADLLGHTTLNRVDLILDLEEPLPPLRGDGATLSHCLINLCVNAVDAMPGGGTVRFSTRRTAGGGLDLAVRDTGAGMSPEVLARAMEPFFTTKPPGQGTGLGLAMVYGAMQAHDGTVTLRSQPGQGTEVLLAFPASRLEPEPPPELPSGPAPRAPQPRRILVVDDDALVQASMAAMLRTLGHRATCAGGGEAALGLLGDGLEVDLVILDLNMPGMTGAQALPRIRALRPDLPVLLASGFFDHSAAAIQETHARLRLIHKPFAVPEIQQGIEDLLEGGDPDDPSGAPAGARAIRRILLVDDEEDVRILTGRMFRGTGLDLETAASGEEALQRLEGGSPPDLVILDQTMPRMDGVQTLERIRTRHPGLPVLISSGRPDIQEWACFKQPGVGCITKPFTLDELLAKLKPLARFRPNGS